MKKEYSAAIAAVINDYLTQDDWSFSFDEEIGIFKFNLSVKGKIQQISYFIDVKESEYIVYAISPIGADIRDKGMMANMAEFICRANYNLRMGNFEFDCSDGEIRFKVDVCCDGILPTLDMVRKSIYCPALMFGRYGNGIVDVVFCEVSGEEAIKKCES